MPAHLPMAVPAPSKACWPSLLLLLALLVQGGHASTDGARGAIPLVPFQSVFSCLPFSLLIRPSGGGGAPATDGGAAAAAGGPTFRLLLDTADANITGAFNYAVTPDGTLHLNLAMPVATNSCASAVVELPADALREVRQASAPQRHAPPARARRPAAEPAFPGCRLSTHRVQLPC